MSSTRIGYSSLHHIRQWDSSLSDNESYVHANVGRLSFRPVTPTLTGLLCPVREKIIWAMQSLKRIYCRPSNVHCLTPSLALSLPSFQSREGTSCRVSVQHRLASKTATGIYPLDNEPLVPPYWPRHRDYNGHCSHNLSDHQVSCRLLI